MALEIEDYALIGNLQTAALVGNNGSIDWLCLPRFDSGACLASLLGNPDHGHWKIEPEGSYRVSRTYREGTAILETLFETDHGSVRLIDCMIPNIEEADLVRLVEGVDGEVPIRMTMSLRFDYGSIIPWIQYHDHELMAIAGPDMIHIYASVPMAGSNLKTESNFTIKADQVIPFTLNWHPSHLEPRVRLDDPYREVEKATQWWRDWSAQSTYQGKWQDAVQRSLVTLKSLIHAPSGGIVAAPTTSLPEQPGGVRNWDYRFCWLRDATFTLYSLLTAGYVNEARAWREWLLRAIAGRPSDVRIMYGLMGERRLTELNLDWLPGYENSKPIRIGNDASKQLQLDVFGEVMDTLHLGRKSNIEAYDTAWHVQQELLEHLETIWQDPDEGIWEVRGPRRHFTHSKVMAWVALDRGIKAIEQYNLPGPIDRWKSARQEIYGEICEKGFSRKMNSFVQYYGSDELDASLLLVPLVGLLPPSDPRVIGTVEAIEKHLTVDGFVLRYLPRKEIDGLPGDEGAFLACSFWLVDNLHLLGRRDDARKLFDRLLSIQNDVGLLAEEYDPVSKRMLGNFPQAFSHVSLVNTARSLSAGGGPAEDRPKQRAEPVGSH